MNHTIWKTHRLRTWILGVSLLMTTLPVLAGEEGVVVTDGVHFVHTATVSNISSSWTYLDHHLLNANPGAIIHVTQNWNPGGSGGTYNDSVIGVYYDPFVMRWTVFNQDLAPIPVGADFNISIASNKTASFTHTATAGNTLGAETFVVHPVTDFDPNVIVEVAPGSSLEM